MVTRLEVNTYIANTPLSNLRPLLVEVIQSVLKERMITLIYKFGNILNEIIKVVSFNLSNILTSKFKMCYI